MRDIFEDPNKLLQLILAAESNRGGGGGGNGPGFGGGGPVAGQAVQVVGLAQVGRAGQVAAVVSGKPGKLRGGGVAVELAPAQALARVQALALVAVLVSAPVVRVREPVRARVALELERVQVVAALVAGQAQEVAQAGSGTGSGTGTGTGTGAGEPGKWMTASALLRGGVLGGVPGVPGMGPSGGGGYGVAEEEVKSMIGLFAQLGKLSKRSGKSRMDAATFQSRLSALPVRAQFTLQQALAGLAAQAPMDKPDKPMLLKLAEHVAIRFALDSYERGGVARQCGETVAGPHECGDRSAAKNFGLSKKR